MDDETPEIPWPEHALDLIAEMHRNRLRAARGMMARAVVGIAFWLALAGLTALAVWAAIHRGG